eukprot:TRINITY_DN7419_c0_g1_i1.p1 TRINITY_DN7419_c0_g1~~TRINITY_DN7419_c0_g1_i1.p1  ORF type:complete len:1131 (+),score=266.92 TRINITY_DN7419_c0_g1_i1:44-3394(+)
MDEHGSVTPQTIGRDEPPSPTSNDGQGTASPNVRARAHKVKGGQLSSEAGGGKVKGKKWAKLAAVVNADSFVKRLARDDSSSKAPQDKRKTSLESPDSPPESPKTQSIAKDRWKKGKAGVKAAMALGNLERAAAAAKNEKEEKKEKETRKSVKKRVKPAGQDPEGVTEDEITRLNEEEQAQKVDEWLLKVLQTHQDEESEEDDEEWDGKDDSEDEDASESESSMSAFSDDENDDVALKDKHKSMRKVEKMQQKAMMAGNCREALELDPTLLATRYVPPPHADHDLELKRIATFTTTSANRREEDDQGNEMPKEYKRERRKALDLAQLGRARGLQAVSDPRTDVAREQREHPGNSLLWEEDADFPIIYVKSSLDHSALQKTAAHYRALPSQEAHQYHCLVNLGCCHMALNQSRLAKPLFKQAAEAQPTRAAALLNLINCCQRVFDRLGAMQATEKALREAEDLTAEQHRFLLQTRKALSAYFTKNLKRGEREVHAGKQKAGGRKSTRSRSKEVKRATFARQARIHAQPVSHVEFFELRKELRSLRGDAGKEKQEPVKPLWGRNHAYAGEQEDAVLKQKARWQPLTPEELEILRFEFAQAANSQAEQVSSADSSSEEDNVNEVRGPRGEGARRAYEAVKSLPGMHVFPPHKARAMLRSANLIDVPANTKIFEQGDFALHIYIIVKGSVTITIHLPAFGPDPVPVETLYDGQVFGDAKVATWRQAHGEEGQVGPARRKGTATAQEDVVLLEILPDSYRRAIGAPDPSDERAGGKKGSNADDEDVAGASGDISQLLPEVYERVQALSSSPLFEGAPSSSLVRLATNMQQVDLRYGDVFLEQGQPLQACFLVAEGLLRFSVPTVDMDEGAGLGGLNDTARVSGMGRRPSSVVAGTPPGGTLTPRQDSVTSAPPVNTSRPSSARGSRPGSARLAPGPSRVFSNQASGAPSTPVFQFGERPPLLPTTLSCSVAASAVGGKRPSVLTPRKPGTPRKNTPWERTLRQECTAPFAGLSPTQDVEMAVLLKGEAFGLGTLLDTKGECPYNCGCKVRVESNHARLLVLTLGSLLFLTEAVARTLVERIKETEDPAGPRLEAVKKQREHHSTWLRRKHRVLNQVMMRID